MLTLDDGRVVLAGGLSVTADPTYWMLARATGLTAYLLLTTSVIAGLVLKSRPFRSLGPAAVTDTTASWRCSPSAPSRCTARR